MKNLTKMTSIIALASVMGLGASVAVGAPGGPHGKASVMHCGCNLAGDDMEYKEISISSKSRGHDAHEVSSIDSCFDGVDTYTELIRTGSDCQLSGPALGDPIGDCINNPVPPVAGEDCGALVTQP